MDTKYDFVIVGAGLAGLTAAIELEKFNLKLLIIDAEDRAGGRLKTDNIDSFLLDRGFQVFLDAYPEAKDQLDYESLNLKSYKSGALCFDRFKKFEVSDTTRNKAALPKMLLSPVGSLMDKVRIGNLNARLKAATLEEIFERPEHTTLDYLKQSGYSQKIINRFFKPFFSGIFLDNELQTSSRMFEFVFKMLAEGNATLPANGMEAIPHQLKEKLERTEFRFHTKAVQVSPNAVTTSEGDTISCKGVIVAAEADHLIPGFEGSMKWQETATYYFSADQSPLSKQLIALNYHAESDINLFSVPSDVAASYAPKGKHLISVSLKNIPKKSTEQVAEDIKRELSLAFGESILQWKFIKNYHIHKALPTPENMKAEIPFTETRLKPGLYLAGDYLLNGSINGAMRSGHLAAQAAIFDYNANA